MHQPSCHSLLVRDTLCLRSNGCPGNCAPADSGVPGFVRIAHRLGNRQSGWHRHERPDVKRSKASRRCGNLSTEISPTVSAQNEIRGFEAEPVSLQMGTIPMSEANHACWIRSCLGGKGTAKRTLAGPDRPLLGKQSGFVIEAECAAVANPPIDLDGMRWFRAGIHGSIDASILNPPIRSVSGSKMLLKVCMNAPA